MLQVKALPIAAEKPKPQCKSTSAVRIALFVFGSVFALLSIPFGLLTFAVLSLPLAMLDWAWLIFFLCSPLFKVFLTLGIAFMVTSILLTVHVWQKSPFEETSIWRKTFFVLGIVLLVPAVFLALHLLERPPQPFDVLQKPDEFIFGPEKKRIYLNATPIPLSERDILWVTDEDIDYMPPMQLHIFFRTLEKPTFSYNFQETYDGVKDSYRIWVTVDIILFLLALGSIVASCFLPKQNVVVTGWSGSDW
jgi:hypothetical protein